MNPSINGVSLINAAQGDCPDTEQLRQRAYAELLRQRAIRVGLLAADDPVPLAGVQSAQASAAIEQLLDRDVPLPSPDDASCRRYFDGNPQQFSHGERLNLRHILFAVTDGVDVQALRQHAEKVLLTLRASAGQDQAELFATTAREQSNCPSSQQGGQLGWLRADDCAPEFAREVFHGAAHGVSGQQAQGILPRLIHSRFGLHIIDVQAREPGITPSFEQALPEVRQRLAQQAYVTALRHYLIRLTSEAEVLDLDLESSASPLLQ